MTEPTRRLPDPAVKTDGKLVAKSVLTPESMKTRGAVALPSSKVIPVVFVPGIMGSNLRTNVDPRKPQNAELKPSEPAWRPPNGIQAGLNEAKVWERRAPDVRQKILDGDTLEVDGSGLIEIPTDMDGIEPGQMRKRGWGEVHWQIYGALLCDLQRNLNQTFEPSLIMRQREPNGHWESVMEYDHEKWNAADLPALTLAELEKFAQYQYPVYACGYNWTQSNELSSQRLKDRVIEIIAFWTKRRFHCKQVILVSHSMGGLVARACAKLIPEQVAGVVHGVMPALGAPAAYRRMAVGTERSSPTASKIAKVTMGKFAQIAGDQPEETTPVMATSCGALELLPNHLYPKPWLIAALRRPDGTIQDLCELFYPNVYDLYRDFESWFKVIDLALVDPAEKYKKKKGGAEHAVLKAIAQAEKFHTKILDTHYHRNTYAFYGADPQQASFGVVRWITNDQEVLKLSNPSLLHVAEFRNTALDGTRWTVMPENFECGGRGFSFRPSEQDAPGDGTVSQQSGDGPRGAVKRLFRTRGYGHQDSYADKHMLKLTFDLVVRIVKEAK